MIKPSIYFHLHLISDATGETLSTIARAASVQFTEARAIEHLYALIRNERDLAQALHEVEQSPGVVLYTIMNTDLRDKLEARCRDLQVPCVSVLDPVLNVLGGYLGLQTSHKPGGQHALNAEYFDRIEALNFTMAHDDGKNTAELDEADVVLLGVSRTSKTPTCIYLANRGIKAANIPLVAGIAPPDRLFELTKPLIVGLTAAPDRLVQIRRNRLLQLKSEDESDYVNMDAVREEVRSARQIFDRLRCPVIDVTRRSIEETAANIISLFHRWMDQARATGSS